MDRLPRGALRDGEREERVVLAVLGAAGVPFESACHIVAASHQPVHLHLLVEELRRAAVADDVRRGAALEEIIHTERLPCASGVGLERSVMLAQQVVRGPLALGEGEAVVRLHPPHVFLDVPDSRRLSLQRLWLSHRRTKHPLFAAAPAGLLIGVEDVDAEPAVRALKE